LSNYGVALNAVNRHAEALESYDKAVEIAPDYAEAHSNRGSTLLDLDRPAEALRSCDRALELKPDYVEALNNRGSALLALNRPADAIEGFNRALALKPNFAKVLLNRSGALLHLNRYSEALADCDRLIAGNPDHAKAQKLRGDALLALHQYADAAASYDRALVREPESPETLTSRGIALQEMGRFENALASFEGALALKPDHVAAIKGRGDALHALQRHEEALASYNEALALRPGDPEAYARRGKTFLELGRYDESLASYNEALLQQPGDPGQVHFDQDGRPGAPPGHRAALSQSPTLTSAFFKSGGALLALGRGGALLAMGRFEEALASLDKAVLLEPDNADALIARGKALFHLNRHSEALRCLSAALDIRPHDEEAREYESLARLWLCDFSGGPAQYEACQHMAALSSEGLDFPQARWDGEESLLGKSILLHAGQTFGDAIQFVRYAPVLSRSGAKVILAVQPALKALLSRIEGTSATYSLDEPLPETHYHCPLESLPFLSKTTSDTVPLNIPYLSAAPDRLAEWRARIPDFKGVRVGLAWAGDPHHKDDVNRSITLHRMAALLAVPRIQFVSLQRTLRDDEMDILENDSRIIHIGEDLHDFDDTAAVLSMMHLVISVDTAVAHLAGAMGKSVWILLPAAPDWRWMLDRIQNPWYPTGRLFRQARAGDWDSTIERVRHELARLVAAAGLGAAVAS
jgi:tetratricopeptide (TPR) repeat protein